MRFGGLIAAIVLAAVAAVVVLRMGNKPQPVVSQAAPVQQEVSATNIYTAARDIPVGSVITEDMVQVQPWPSHLVLPGFVNADSDQNVIGMVARAQFQQQEPILLSKLANANDPNFLAASLPKGMRAITVQTNEIEGVAGFVFPGDYVDVILTHDLKKYALPPSAPSADPSTIAPTERTDTVTETLLTNVKVLAVDQRASNAGAVDQNGNLVIPRSVSLMVTPADAQRIRLGQQKGTLTLSLRALADRESADPLIITKEGDITQYPEQEIGGVDNVRVLRGAPRDNRELMSTGANTSNIQSMNPLMNIPQAGSR